MRNRFDNRQVLCDGIGGFNPVGGSSGINPSNNVNSARPAEVSSISALDAIKNALNIKFESGTAATIAAGEFTQS